MNPLPRLRALEILHLTEEGRPAYLLRDPAGLSDQELVLSEAALFAAAHFDGEHTADDLAEAFERRYGTRPEPPAIEGISRRLEEAYFLETEAFDIRRRELHAAFAGEAVRAPAHAGISYPEDPAEAEAAVRRFHEAAGALEEPGPRPEGPLRGIVSPHIDLRVGGPCTALAHGLLAQSPEVRTVVVLGTAHGAGERGWILLEKPYATPLGTVPVDEEACRRLRDAARTDPEHIFHHRREHSVEFQALFLAGLRAAGRDLAMVPVLCGSLHGNGAPEPPGADPFLAALGDLLREREGTAILVAGADLAHVGPRFGEDEPLSERHLALLERRDRETLDRAAQGDAAGFFRSVTEAGDPRRICGLAPIYGLLSALPGARGKTLRYEQATDPTGTVSYASMGFWG